MKSDKIRALKEYIYPSNSSFIMLTLGTCVFAFLAFLIRPEVVPIICGGILVVLLLWLWRKRYADKAKHLETLLCAENLDEILEDFLQAEPMFRDSLRLGKRYIFCHNQYNILCCKNIRQISQSLQEARHGSSIRTLLCKDNSGRTIGLCFLKANGQDAKEVDKFKQMVSERASQYAVEHPVSYINGC